MPMLVNEQPSILESVLPGERPRLVRLCARLTGSADDAEDLAQETLLEAWRHAHKLLDPTGHAPWLSAIARNVCLRWHQRNGRDLARVVQPGLDQDGDVLELLNVHADDFDLELELERHELATLLDRALALLPPDTRAVLIERYVNETPLAEVAARLGSSDSALKARLHRGKVALRRILLMNFPDEAAAFGILKSGTHTGQETRIWCSQCGQAKLVGSFNPERGELSLGCPNCTPGQATGYSWIWLPAVFQGIKGYRAALSRQMVWVHQYTRQAIKEHTVACLYCTGRATLHLGPSADDVPHLRELQGFHVRCQACHTSVWSSLGSLALSLPEGQRFWQHYPRIHALPEHDIEVDGSAAIVKTYQERAGSARFDVVFARNTLDVIRIFGTPDAEK